MALIPGTRMQIIAVILAATGMAACKDSGLPGRNTPIDEAMRAEWRYPLYQPADAAAGPIQLDGQRWVASQAAVEIPPHLLRPVATSEQGQLHALIWDQQPYTRLYLAAPGGEWTPVDRI